MNQCRVNHGEETMPHNIGQMIRRVAIVVERANEPFTHFLSQTFPSETSNFPVMYSAFFPLKPKFQFKKVKNI